MILRKKYKFNLDNFEKKLNSKNFYKKFCMFIFGILFYAIGISVFFAPNDIVTTGSTGLSILLNNYIKIDLSLIVFAISSIFMVLGFALFDIEYGAKNILGTILLPIFIKATTLSNNIIYFENVSLFLLMVFGSLFMGMGNGLIKRSGYSLGGFYVMYDYISNKFKVSIGTASFICNSIIVILSYFVYGIEVFIYSSIGIYVTSYITDRVMLGVSRNKAFYIITRKATDVKDYIINNLNYTVTIVNAKGGYSDKKKKMLLCVIPTIEYTKVKEVIREIDKDAFFLITDSYSVSK